MKKLLLIIMLSLLTVNVYAANKVVTQGDTDYNTYKTQYEKGIQKTTINGSGIVTLYGYSSCQPGSCAYKYSNTSQDFKEVLKSAVVCSGGEKNIIYQTTGGSDGYKTNNSENYNGDLYWSEDFSITCTNTSNSNTVPLNNSTEQPTNTPTTPNTGSNNGGYNSSNTTNNEDQGVETYYIILGIVGIVTYLLTIAIKKQNLFKKV